MAAEVFADTSEDLEQEGPAESVIDPAVPEGYLRFSEAVSRLTKSMYGNLSRPGVVAKVKKAHRKESIGLACWRERAAERLSAAARTGELAVSLLARPRVLPEQYGMERYVAADREATVVPLEVVRRLLTSRGGLTDHPIRPTRRTAGGNKKLLRSLAAGILVIQETDFTPWRDAERAKGEWLTQRSSSKPRMGRPSKQTARLEEAIRARIHDGGWNGKKSIASLHRMLVADGVHAVPSPDTLERMVDKRWEEKGEIGFARKKRRPRKRL